MRKTDSSDANDGEKIIRLDRGQIRESSYISASLLHKDIDKALLYFPSVCLMKICKTVFPVSEGEMTGVCVNSTRTCEVLAWCPIENDHNIPEYVPTLNNSYCKLTLCMLRSNLEGLNVLKSFSCDLIFV